MIGTSTIEYIILRACILFLHNIAPTSLLYSALFLVSFLLDQNPHAYRLPFPIEVWLLSEAAFYTVVFLPYESYLQRAAIHPEPLSQEERANLFARCNINVSDPEKYIRQWLLGANVNDIKRENVKEFIRWAFWNAGDVLQRDEDEVEDYVRALEKLLGRSIPHGKGSAKSLRLTLDKVNCSHRSLFWYLCVSVVDTITFCSLLYNGFHFHRTSLTCFVELFPFRPLTLVSAYESPAKYLTYWHRPHTSKTRLPILFIHGIGIGLYPYINFLRELNTGGDEGYDGDVGIIALEIMPISSRITHSALEKDVMVREIQAIIRHHGWAKFVLVSHSYGSIISTHLLKSPLTAPAIGNVVLIDPVSFLLHLPDVAYNFTARQPVHANEHLLWYFGSKDIGVAHTLARRFFWSENIIWKEDLGLEVEQCQEGRKVTVVFGGKDILVDTNTVGRYLMGAPFKGPQISDKAIRMASETKTATVSGPVSAEGEEWKTRPWLGSGLEVLWFEQLDHGQVFELERARRSIIKAIGIYTQQKRSS